MIRAPVFVRGKAGFAALAEGLRDFAHKETVSDLAGLDGDAEVDAFELVRRASAGTAGFELAAERTERAEGEARDATERAEPGALMPLARAPVDREEGIAGGGDALFCSALMTLPSKAA